MTGTDSPKHVLIDASWLMHRAKHSVGELSHEGLATGITFGFFEQLHHVCCDPKIQSNKAVIFFDSRRSYRRDYFPEYKASRGLKTPEEYAERLVMGEQSIRLRKEILPDIGFPVVQQYGLESDDLMARAAEVLEGPGATIVTADQDLYQCITSRVAWYDPSRGVWLDTLKFWGLKEIDPKDWVMVKCIAGCSTDNVPGVGGVGEKGAIDYILKRLNEKSVKFKTITSPEGQSVIARNRVLVELPHRRTKMLGNFPMPDYKPDRFFRWCEKLGFKSYIDGGRKHQWEAFFEGRPGGERIIARKRGAL